MSNTLHLEDIPRVKSISKEDFIEHYLKPQKPVVIERLIEDWPAFKKWDFERAIEHSNNETKGYCMYFDSQVLEPTNLDSSYLT